MRVLRVLVALICGAILAAAFVLLVDFLNKPDVSIKYIPPYSDYEASVWFKDGSFAYKKTNSLDGCKKAIDEILQKYPKEVQDPPLSPTCFLGIKIVWEKK